jgi:hypothetical protein
MKGDFTRLTFRKEKHYSSVRRQQGRIDLDADGNEQVDITAYRSETEALDVIGLCGAPKHDAGFAIVDSSGLSSAETTRLTNLGLLPLKSGDFLLGSGRAYVDGILCENEDTVSFTKQPDLAPAPPTGPGRYLAFLDVWQRHLTALDDPGIREVALGGPDTATRTKTVWQVQMLKVGDEGAAVTCSSDPSAWKDTIAASTIKLSARAALEEPSDKPCILPPGAGYRRLENQLYRVEIHRAGAVNDSDKDKVTTFKWSRDNGSVAARIGMIAVSDITLTSARHDPALGFVEGQWIELLDDRNDWNKTPGVLVPILKVADLVLTVDTAQAIAPPGGSLSQFAAALNQKFHPKVRRWDSVGVTAAMIPGTNDGFLALEDGVEVKFATGTSRAGDYWLIPARTDQGNVEWPQDSASPSKPVPQLPHGIIHHFCRLAILDVNATGVVKFIEDCRQLFPPLTEIDDCCGCCTKTVGQTNAADFQSLKDAIGSLPATGGQICVLAGDYVESVLIKGKSNITIIGCGARSKFTPSPPPEGKDGAPIIQLENCTNIRIESLAFAAGLHSAIVVLQSQRVTIRECEIIMSDPKGSEPAIFFQVEDGLIERNLISSGQIPDAVKFQQDPPGGRGVSGIQLAGLCKHVRVIDNLISYVTGQGITLGSLEEANDGGKGPIIGEPKNPKDKCDDCKPPTKKIPNGPPPGSKEKTPSLASPDSLIDLHIERNRIFSVGLDGIGVIGFFDLSAADEFVTVYGLTILGNEIRDGLWIAAEPIDEQWADWMGYGGISLADVSGLVIYDNVIENNGPWAFESVCGIFVLHGQGIDISRNHIMGNGVPAGAFSVNPKNVALSKGRRGGIQIVYALAPMLAEIPSPKSEEVFVISKEAKGEPTGFPALKVHDNIVSAPTGPALSAVALGPVSVVGNQLTSDGLVQTEQSVFAPATVFIFNLGVSNEAYFQQLLFKFIGKKPTAPSDNFDDFRLGDRLADGNILFANNQCSLDLLEPAKSNLFSSLVFFSLDDIAFQDNQCDCNLGLFEDFVVTHALLLGATLRVTGNRFKEGFFSAFFSAITAAILNMTAHNQATHCLLVLGPPGLTQDGPNTVLVDALVPGWCANLPRLLEEFFGGHK